MKTEVKKKKKERLTRKGRKDGREENNEGTL